MRRHPTLEIFLGALALLAPSLSAVPSFTLHPVAIEPGEALADNTDRVSWRLAPRSILGGDDEASLRLRCGYYGVFDFNVEEAEVATRKRTVAARKRVGTLTPACTGISCGSEHPPLYPSTPAPAALAAKAGPWIPCPAGSCFASRGLAGYTPGRPWIAVLDWDNLHGWSVGWTILGIANRDLQSPTYEAVLLPLDEARLIPFSRTGSTDVHVLTQLCTILEEVEIGGIAPPKVINMSFGRRLKNEDTLSPAGCDPATLSCQIARVLARIVGQPTDQEPRTVPVASAGNDQEPLFPAGLTGVLPAGSLQLGQLEHTGGIELSWETPSYAPRAQALMPGYGLCIGEKIGGDSFNEWAAPPGTSYAAAVFSGWLAETLEARDIRKPLAAFPWFPAQSCSADHTVCTYVLTHGTVSYAANPRIDGLFGRMFQPHRQRPCGTPSPAGSAEILHLAAQPASPSVLPAETFLDVFADFKLPAPHTTPCIPCRGMTSIDGVAAGGASKANPQGFYLDLSGASPLFPPFPPELAQQVEVEELYLRIGDLAFLQLLPSDDQPMGLTALEAGSIHRLAVTGVPDLVWGSAQPSLIFVLRPTQADLLERRFWVSIPILLDQ